jgi:hypothetical protein
MAALRSGGGINRPPPERHQVSTRQTRQALVDHAEVAVPRCLTIEQRMTFLATFRLSAKTAASISS